MSTAGYSTTALAQKLSLKDGMRVWWDCMPDSVRAEIKSSGLALKQLESGGKVEFVALESAA